MSRQINLFNPAFQKQKKHFSALTMVQAFGLVIAGSVIFYFYASHRVAEVERQSKQTAKRLEIEQARVARISKEIVPRQKSPALVEEIRRLEEQLRVQQEEFAALQGGYLGKPQGFSEFMRALARQHVEGLWLTGFSIAGGGNEITLEGRALRPELVPLYIRRLRQEPAMQGRAFSTLEMRRPRVEAVKDKPAAVRYIEFSLRSKEPEQSAETR